MLKPNRTNLEEIEKRFRSLPRKVKTELRRYQRSEVGPIWKEEVKKNLGANPMAKRVFKAGNTVRTGSQIVLEAKGSTKRLQGTGITSDLIEVAEFGSKRQNKFKKYSRTSPKGKRHTVNRRVSRQSPAYRAGGYVIYPASKKAVKRISSLSVQTVMRTLHDSIEGR